MQLVGHDREIDASEDRPVPARPARNAQSALGFGPHIMIRSAMARAPIAKIDTSTPVVVFRAETYCALGIVRSLGRMGTRVYCVDQDRAAVGTKSRYCVGTFEWDFESSDPADSAQFLVDVARKIGQKAILLSTGDTRSLLVDQYREMLSKWYVLPRPKARAVAQLYSKQSLFALCKSTGVPTPETVFPESIEQALRDSSRLQFPLVIKAIEPDRLARRTGRRMAVVRQQSELRGTYRALDEPGVSNLALQEFIPGNAQDAWILAAYFDAKSDCRFVITGQKLRQLPIDGGVTTLGVCTPCESMVDSIGRVARAVGYHGIVDACFRYDARDGRWNLLDVNPRPGANFRLFVDKYGMDVVRALYLDLTGQKLPAAEPLWGRRWMVEDNDLVAFRARKREGSLTFGGWLGSLRGVSELAYFAVDDPWPAATALFSLIADRIRGVLRRSAPPE